MFQKTIPISRDIDTYKERETLTHKEKGGKKQKTKCSEKLQQKYNGQVNGNTRMAERERTDDREQKGKQQRFQTTNDFKTI
jgi:hypothetical protein